MFLQVLRCLEKHVVILGFLLTLFIVYCLYVSVSLLDILVSFEDKLVECKDCVVVASLSVAPFTSTIPLKSLPKLIEEFGADRYSVYVFAPVVVEGTASIVCSINESIVEPRCPLCVYTPFASEGILEVLTPFSSFNGYLIPVGVSNTTCILANPAAARALRGIGSGLASIIVLEGVKRRPSTLKAGLAERLVMVLERRGFRLHRSYTDVVLERLGLSRSLVIALLASLAVILCSGLYLVGFYIVWGCRGSLKTLNMLGVPMDRLKLTLLTLATLNSVASTLVTMALVSLHVVPHFKILGVIIEPSLDTVLISTVLASSIAFEAAGVMSARVES